MSCEKSLFRLNNIDKNIKKMVFFICQKVFVEIFSLPMFTLI